MALNSRPLSSVHCPARLGFARVHPEWADGPDASLVLDGTAPAVLPGVVLEQEEHVCSCADLAPSLCWQALFEAERLSSQAPTESACDGPLLTTTAPNSAAATAAGGGGGSGVLRSSHLSRRNLVTAQQQQQQQQQELEVFAVRPAPAGGAQQASAGGPAGASAVAERIRAAHQAVLSGRLPPEAWAALAIAVENAQTADRHAGGTGAKGATRLQLAATLIK